jgi:hypothetical protein
MKNMEMGNMIEQKICRKINAWIAFGFLICFALLARAERDRLEGALWLKWSIEHRDAFVMAYVEGYYDGYSHGCQEGTKPTSVTVQSESVPPYQECINRKLDLAKGTDLAEEVTKFYQQYPENRNLFVREILLEIGKGKSLLDIHNHPPYPPVSATEQQNRRNLEN